MSIQFNMTLNLSTFRLRAESELAATGITALIGASGSGKSTLLRCLAGLEPLGRGYLKVGEEVWQDSKKGHCLPPYRRPVGYVFQAPALFPHLTVEGNLQYAWKRRGRDGPSPREVGELMGIARLFPRDVASLSGGEQQRVALARAALSGPRWLLLDEPLAALDQEGKEGLLMAVESLSERLRLPVLYVTHAMAEVIRLADSVIRMEEGLIVERGSPDALLGRGGKGFHDRAEPVSLLEVTGARRDEAYCLTYLRCGELEFAMPGGAALPERKGRLAIWARDVSLALERPRSSSILNAVQGQVASIRPYDEARSLVGVRGQGVEVRSLVTRLSVEELGLREGVSVWAMVKAVSLLSD